MCRVLLVRRVHLQHRRASLVDRAARPASEANESPPEINLSQFLLFDKFGTPARSLFSAGNFINEAFRTTVMCFHATDIRAEPLPAALENEENKNKNRIFFTSTHSARSHMKFDVRLSTMYNGNSTFAHAFVARETEIHTQKKESFFHCRFGRLRGISTQK